MVTIGTLGEKHLHAALKEWFLGPGDRAEVEVDGFVVDVVRADELIEIQTRGFSRMGRKLDRLLDGHRVRVVHPVAAEKWICRASRDGNVLSRRRSPKRGIPADVCAELVSFPTLLSHPHFTLEIVLVAEEEVRQRRPEVWRRKGWALAERRLIEVRERVALREPGDLLALLPQDLEDPFTTADLGARLGRPPRLARAVAYCLREAGVVRSVGRARDGIRYRRR